MNLTVSGDALRFLEQLIHYGSLYPGWFARAMDYDLDPFVSQMRSLENAFHEAVNEQERPSNGRSLKRQAPLPDDFDSRFPNLVGEKIKEWLLYKSERKDFYHPTGLRNLLAQIETRAKRHSIESIVTLISECMANNWAGIVWAKIDQPSARTQDRRDRRYLRAKASSFESPWVGFHPEP